MKYNYNNLTIHTTALVEAKMSKYFWELDELGRELSKDYHDYHNIYIVDATKDYILIKYFNDGIYYYEAYDIEGNYAPITVYSRRKLSKYRNEQLEGVLSEQGFEIVDEYTIKGCPEVIYQWASLMNFPVTSLVFTKGVKTK